MGLLLAIKGEFLLFLGGSESSMSSHSLYWHSGRDGLITASWWWKSYSPLSFLWYHPSVCCLLSDKDGRPSSSSCGLHWCHEALLLASRSKSIVFLLLLPCYHPSGGVGFMPKEDRNLVSPLSLCWHSVFSPLWCLNEIEWLFSETFCLASLPLCWYFG